MAQINITLNQEEILQLLTNNKEDAFKKLFQESLNALIIAESDEKLSASKYERSEERTDSRNGYRDKQLTTKLGNITLKVPRHRNQPFHSLIYDNYERCDQALILTMAEMVVNGVSTRKVSKVMETLCGESFSKSTVSNACKTLDQKVKDFKQRRLETEYPFVLLDATYFKVRENHRIVSKAMMIAVASRYDGYREIIGFQVYDNESSETWSTFLKSLKNRGLHNVRMFISDSHKGILNAIAEHYPTTPWQKCQAHFTKNVIEKAPKKHQEGLRLALNEIYNCETIEKARKKRDEIIDEYIDIAEKSMQCLEEGFDSAMTVMMLPLNYRRYYRTNNHLERLNRELKRRSKVIGIFPNMDSLERIIGSVAMEENEKYAKNKSSAVNTKIYEAIKKCGDNLIEYARLQHELILAA